MLEVAKTATKPSPVPLQKHSPAGCTIDMPRSNYRQQRHIILHARYLVLKYVIAVYLST